MSASSSTADDKATKAARKEALKAEAAKLGMSYEELKAEKKRKKAEKEADKEAQKKPKRKMSEAEILATDSLVAHEATQNKRMRSYSKDMADDATRRRTRSMDAAEEKKEEEKKKVDESNLSDADWRKSHQLTVFKQSDRSYEPIEPFRKFTDAPFNADIQRALKQAGYEAPTVIQSQAWPIAIAGNDMISIAKTGSGKTAGFLLPCLHQFLSSGNKNGGGFSGPMMLVLAPTRELAQQILGEVQKFGRTLRVRSVCCYGGAPKYPQVQALRKGVEIVVATPGRMNDLLDQRATTLKNVKYFVLDEADRMLDMGFEPQIRSIISHMGENQQKQTLLFSATWPKEIQNLAAEFLSDPVQVNVGDANRLNANKDITQKIELVRDDEKIDKLKEILDDLVKSSDGDEGSAKKGPQVANEKTHAKAIIFVAKKMSCDALANQLWEEGYAVDSLHGDRAQWERTKVTNAFKSGQLRLLIATDVAARGLDVKDVGVVVNFDMPTGTNGVEDYVHRIGRTGRAGKKGKAYTFFTNSDRKNAGKLLEVLKRAEQEIPAFLEAMGRPRGGFGGRGGGRGYGGRGSRGRGGGGGRSYMGGGSRGRGGRGFYRR